MHRAMMPQMMEEAIVFVTGQLSRQACVMWSTITIHWIFLPALWPRRKRRSESRLAMLPKGPSPTFLHRALDGIFSRSSNHDYSNRAHSGMPIGRLYSLATWHMRVRRPLKCVPQVRFCSQSWQPKLSVSDSALVVRNVHRFLNVVAQWFVVQNNAIIVSQESEIKHEPIQNQ